MMAETKWMHSMTLQKSNLKCKMSLSPQINVFLYIHKNISQWKREKEVVTWDVISVKTKKKNLVWTCSLDEKVQQGAKINTNKNKHTFHKMFSHIILVLHVQGKKNKPSNFTEYKHYVMVLFTVLLLLLR